jgi:hypothetical protein
MRSSVDTGGWELIHKDTCVATTAKNTLFNNILCEGKKITKGK